MTTLWQHWRLAITPLSPVHMGTGRDYEPTGYVIDQGTLYEFDGIAALGALPPSERDRLGRILEGRPTLDMLLQVQGFFHKNRETLAAVSRNQVRVNPTIEAFYQERVGRVVQHETGGGRIQNRLEIERTAWNPPTGQAILPGSGLKGAMRTALLDAVNDGKALSPDLSRDRRANQRLQETLFDYRMGQLEQDPLRLIRVGDAALRDPQNFATEVRVAVNRKKRPVQKDGVLLQSRAEQQGLYQLLECLPAFQPRAFEGSLSIQGDGGVSSPKWPKRPFRAAEIVTACNRFYRQALERELTVLRAQGFVDSAWDQRLQALFAGPISAALDQGRALLLRVGRHSGAESVTLNGVRNIKIMKGRGEPPDFLAEAKTLWLASDERMAQRDLMPFGWLLVELYEQPSELPAWPEVGVDPGFVLWRKQAGERRNMLAAKLQEELRRVEEQTLAAEAAARAEQERAARRATLSDEEQAIEELSGWLAEDRAAQRTEAGGRLAQRFNELCQQAVRWPLESRVKLASLGEAIYGLIGWGSGAKKQQKRERISSLRGKC